MLSGKPQLLVGVFFIPLFNAKKTNKEVSNQKTRQNI
mgnify:CR=1 FL=1